MSIWNACQRLAAWVPWNKTKIAVVPMKGVILDQMGSMTPGASKHINLRRFGDVLKRAFESKPALVALQISSPGGSPVQSNLLFSRIRSLKKKAMEEEEIDVPVVAFVEDVAASGGYFIAAAADEIVCDPSSIVGSIGVMTSSFGLHDILKQHGVERRVFTAGTRKSMLDPFKPLETEDVTKLNEMLSDIHSTFIERVKEGRGARLEKAKGQDLFNGEAWTARRALGLGLVDALDDMLAYCEKRFGTKLEFEYYHPKTAGLLSALSGGSDALARLASTTEDGVSALLDRFQLRLR